MVEVVLSDLLFVIALVSYYLTNKLINLRPLSKRHDKSQLYLY
jgi:hypothetical protein